MEKESPEIPHIWRLSRQRAFTLILLALVLLGLRLANRISVLNAEHSLILDRCRALDAKPSSLAQLHAREHSDRFEPGTKPVLLRNARLWTGARNGTEVIHGSLFLDQGIIQTVGGVDLHRLPPDTVVLDANHSWVTAGLVDLHSNAAGFPLPALEGARDLNSPNGPVLPWLRTWDALNTHDDAYALSIAGGVTSALIHPGSANVIGKL